jgi:hypothetical protein
VRYPDAGGGRLAGSRRLAKTHGRIQMAEPERCADYLRRSLPILRTLGPKMKAPAGMGPTGASVEGVMRKHRNLLPKMMLIPRIRVKIIIIRR